MCEARGYGCREAPIVLASDMGHNIIADGWAGASNPPFTFSLTHKTTQEASKTLVLDAIRLNHYGRTDGPMGRWTDGQSLL